MLTTKDAIRDFSADDRIIFAELAQCVKGVNGGRPVLFAAHIIKSDCEIDPRDVGDFIEKFTGVVAHYRAAGPDNVTYVDLARAVVEGLGWHSRVNAAQARRWPGHSR